MPHYTYQRVRLAAVALTFGIVVGCAELPSRQAAQGEEPRFDPIMDFRPRLALVLSSGTLRGFAHIGVLKALEAHGIRPDLVVGTSAGAIVAGLYASGMLAPDLVRAGQAVDFDLTAAWIGAQTGLGKSPVHEFARTHLRTARIERFPVRFAAIATDLQQGCLEIFNAGDAAVAIQASAALPGVFTPTQISGRMFVDGGLLSPVPVRVARALGAQRVIAVNVTFDPNESRLVSVVDRLFQTMLIMTRSLAIEEARTADILIEPQLPPEELITLANRDALVAAGEHATVAALPSIAALLKQNGAPFLDTHSRRPDVRSCKRSPAAQTAEKR